MSLSSYCFHLRYTCLLLNRMSLKLLCLISCFITFFFTPLAVLPQWLLSFMYEYILLLNPMNSLIEIPDVSLLNFPITFLFDLSKYGEFSGYSLLSNLYLLFQKSVQTSSVSISYVRESVSVNNSLVLLP